MKIWGIVILVVLLGFGCWFLYSTGVKAGKVAATAVLSPQIDSLKKYVASLEEQVAVNIPGKESIVYVTHTIAAKKDTVWKEKYVFEPDSFGKMYPGAIYTINYNRVLGKVNVLTYGGEAYESPEKVGSFFIQGDDRFLPTYEPFPSEEVKIVPAKIPFIYGNILTNVQVLPSWQSVTSGDKITWKSVSNLRATLSPGLVIGSIVRLGISTGVEYSNASGWSPFVGLGATIKLVGRW